MEPLKILIVDDDDMVCEMICFRLSRDAPHFSTAVVQGGLECIEYMESHRVDCVISDYQMPGMNGLELLRTLRKNGNDVPFIFITGQGSVDLAKEAFKAGADDYFPKNLGLASFTQVLNSIDSALELRASRRRQASSAKAPQGCDAARHAPVACSSKAVWRFDIVPPIPVSLDEEEQVERIFRQAYLAECNDEGARILGLASADDAVGMCHIAIVPFDDPRNKEHILKAVRAGYWLKEDEFFTRDVHGGTRCVLGAFRGIVEDGRLVRAWGVGREHPC